MRRQVHAFEGSQVQVEEARDVPAAAAQPQVQPVGAVRQRRLGRVVVDGQGGIEGAGQPGAPAGAAAPSVLLLHALPRGAFEQRGKPPAVLRSEQDGDAAGSDFVAGPAIRALQKLVVFLQGAAALRATEQPAPLGREGHFPGVAVRRSVSAMRATCTI